MRQFAVFMFAALTLAPLSQAHAFSLKQGGATSQPAGHFQFCKRGGRHCGSHKEAGPAKLTDARMNALNSVNRRVNGSIRAASDMVVHGVAEHWKEGGRSGDCEDFAMKKRSMLLGRGFHPSQLRLAKTRLRNGEAHIVLVVRTDKGDFVLDNLTNKVKPWRSTNMRFLKMQSFSNDNLWVRVRG
ncbi:MAG: transglutaminase-like cysteine peptidase [Pseudomonadota bacterium]